MLSLLRYDETMLLPIIQIIYQLILSQRQHDSPTLIILSYNKLEFHEQKLTA